MIVGPIFTIKYYWHFCNCTYIFGQQTNSTSFENQDYMLHSLSNVKYLYSCHLSSKDVVLRILKIPLGLNYVALTCTYLTISSLFIWNQCSLFLISIIVCFKQYCPPMFLDSLTSPLTASSTSVTTTSPHESNTHVSSSSSRSETGVITSSGRNIPDIISLD